MFSQLEIKYFSFCDLKEKRGKNSKITQEEMSTKLSKRRYFLYMLLVKIFRLNCVFSD